MVSQKYDHEDPIAHRGDFRGRMVCSSNYGPLLVMDVITAPHSKGYQNGTLIVATTDMTLMWPSSLRVCNVINYYLKP